MSALFTVFEEVAFATPVHDEMVALRTQVLRVPLGLAFTAEELAGEHDQHHMGLFGSHHQLLACLLFKPEHGDVWKMRQVAVHPKHQKQGHGRRLIAEAEVWARERGAQVIYAEARDAVVPFYDRLGYATVGELYTHIGIPHQRMERHMS